MPQRSGFTTISLLHSVRHERSLHNRGFTLIELLITISIIAVLSVIGLVAYTSFLKNSRDSKRQADVKFIQSALEEYHADLLFYPTAAGLNGVLSSGGLFNSSTGIGSGTPPTTAKTYLNAVPKDPLTTTPTRYFYVTTPSSCDNTSSNRCKSYTLYAKLENPPPGSGSYNFNSAIYNFQVTPP